MWRSSARPAALAAAVAACLIGGAPACASEDVPADGAATDAARAVVDPVAAMRAGVEELAAETDETRLRVRARELADLLARDEFESDPDARGRLRVDLLYVANPPAPEERAAALQRARKLAARF